MWEILKFFLCCVGFCCLVSAFALAYMILKGPEGFVEEVKDEEWYR